MPMDETQDDVAGHTRVRKGQIRNEYSSESESDSDDDNAQPEQSQAIDKNDDDDNDSDMFASDDEPAPPPPDKRRKNVLDMDKFNQEAGIEDGPSDEEQIYENYDKVQDYYNSIEDGTRSGLKLEPKIEAFSLKAEEQEGHFDNDGNFVREQQSEDEDWLSSIKKSDIAKAKQAEEQREIKLQQKSAVALSMEELLVGIIEILDPAETPMEALRRFAPNKTRRKIKSDDKERSQTATAITDICSKLSIAKGLDDIFEMTREELMRLYKTETGHDIPRGTKRQRDDDSEEEQDGDSGDKGDYGEKVWEYEWLDEPGVLGPFSDYEMNYWKETYFNKNVQVRRIGESQFTHIDDVTFNV